MSRLPNWRARLTTHISQSARTPIVPGTHDCALFLAGAVQAQTGIDYALPYRGKYTTLASGLKLIRRDGFADHIALAEHHLERKPTAFLAPGDGAVVKSEDGRALGVVQGAMVYVVGWDRTDLVRLTDVEFGFAV